MRISARCDYACKAIVELAMQWPQREPVQVKEIAEKHNIPVSYLVNILNQLKMIGVVKSIRGPQGGYLLKVAPDQIKLSRVLKAIGGPLLPVANTIKEKETVFDSIWEELEEAMEKVLGSITFEDICNRVSGKDSVITYSI